MQECELGLEAEIAVHVFDDRNVARIAIELGFDLLRLANSGHKRYPGIIFGCLCCIVRATYP